MPVRSALRYLNRVRTRTLLPRSARDELRRDRNESRLEDPGAGPVIAAGLRWLGRAQDHSKSGDGGVARHFSLITGWHGSYPETTGYIVPTILACAARGSDPSLRSRAKRMLDWLVRIQCQDGPFCGGSIGAAVQRPTTFNTGQILLGLAAGAREWPEFRTPMRRAADWLVNTQDSDGCWRQNSSPFTADGPKAYDAHVAWGLLEASELEPDRGYVEAAMRNIQWVLTNQTSNGWFDNCCLNRNDRPLSHTLGYALRGLLELQRLSRDSELLARAELTADGLLSTLDDDGWLSGRFHADWSPAVSWSCLTGTSQIAACWWILYEETGKERYRDAAHRANQFVRRTIRVDSSPRWPDDVVGGVKGSLPVDGNYGPFQYLNWACKFTIDANLMEMDATIPAPQVNGGSRSVATPP